MSTNQLWLTDLRLSNDASEGNYGYDFIRGLLKDNPNQQLADYCLYLLSNIQKITTGLGICFSEEEDMLSQWRAYANNAKGMSIGFDAGELKKICQAHELDNQPYQLNRVLYDPYDQKTLLMNCVNDLVGFLEDSPTVNDPLPLLMDTYLLGPVFEHIQPFLQVIFFIKNHFFHEEKEWRIVANTMYDVKIYNKQEVFFNSSDDRLSPYIKIPVDGFPKGLIKQIILGPQNKTPMNVMHLLLAKYGIENVEVKHSSGSSYR